MTRHHLLNWTLAAFIALGLSCTYLLDGPSDIQAIQDTSASVIDAQVAAASAHATQLDLEQP